MPKYLVETDQGNYEVELEKEATSDAQLRQLVSQHIGAGEGTVSLGEFTTFPQPLSPDEDESEAPELVYIDPHTGKRLPTIGQGKPAGILEKVQDYLGIRQPETTPLELEAMEKGVTPFQIRKEIVGPGAANIEEARRVVGRGFAGVTGGITDLIKGYEENPETWPGAFVGAGAELAGFLVGPYKGTKLITGARLAPTARGLQGVAQVMTEGAANLGMASMLSEAAPALMHSDTLTEYTFKIAESGTMGGLVGFLFPAMGAIPTKPLRLAVSLAVMDKIRAGPHQWFTIDDVMRGVKDGTISATDLSRASFGYLMDIYFTLKVPSMKKQLAALENTMTKEISGLNVAEVEQTIVGMGKRGDIGPEAQEGITKQDVLRSYGSEEQFKIIGGGAPPSQSDASQVETMFNKADTELAALRSKSWKQMRKELARATIDVSAEVKKQLLEQGGDLGREAVIRHDLIRGMSAKADTIFAAAEKDIWGGLDKVDQKLLDRVIQARRTITLDKHRERLMREDPEGASEFLKHPDNLTGTQHQSYLDTLKLSDPERFARINESADKYFAAMKQQLTDLNQAGLISQESFDRLAAVGDYSPRRFIQHIDPDRTYGFGGKTISVPDSGLKKIDTGSIRNMENNSRLLLSDVVARTHRRIARNEANRALWNLAEQVSVNPIVKKLGPKQTADAESETISVVIDGKQERMAMPRELAQQWVESDPAINAQMANIVGWLSGANILKPMATGLNPEFALTNMPRDIIHVWLSTHEYSPHFPKFAAQIAKDYAQTAKEAIFRTGAYADYINEGGGMSFLTHQGRITSKGQGVWANIQDVLGYLGETSEVWTRLALRNRALRNGSAPHEATWIARNYLDFSQGGWAIKGADTAIPYLNASVQATRGVFRAAKERPGETTWKFAQLASIASGLYLANRIINEDAWNSIPAREKVNNFIFTTPLSYTDEEGNKRWLYFTVAKDQSQRVVSSVFEGMMAKMMGDPIDGDQIAQSVQDFLPLMPTDTMPPTISAMMGYYANKDFWRNEDIWKGPAVAAREEYTRYTHPLLREVGQVTGLSPERTKHVLTQFFTYGNIYTSAVGAGTSKIMEALGEEAREQTTQDMLRSIPGLRRMMKATEPFEPFRKEIEDVRLEDQTQRFVINRDLDLLSERYWKAKTEGAETEGADQAIRQFIGTQSPVLREELIRRHLFMGKVFAIPDKRFWMSLHDMSPEARATVFWTRWMQSDAAEKRALMERAGSIPGMVSERFIMQLDKLKKSSEVAQ